MYHKYITNLILEVIQLRTALGAEIPFLSSLGEAGSCDLWYGPSITEIYTQYHMRYIRDVHHIYHMIGLDHKQGLVAGSPPLTNQTVGCLNVTRTNWLHLLARVVHLR